MNISLVHQLPLSRLLLPFVIKARNAFIRAFQACARPFLVPKLEVLTGPFAGMKYPYASNGSAVFPKLLGTYESEISELFRYERLKRYRTFIDIGCAEGYYLVGVAM